MMIIISAESRLLKHLKMPSLIYREYYVKILSASPMAQKTRPHKGRKLCQEEIKLNIALIIAVVFCIVVLVMLMNKKKKYADAHKSGLQSLQPGMKIRTVNGMLGTVVEMGSDSIKADFSPDQSGSIIEVAKDAFYGIEK